MANNSRSNDKLINFETNSFLYIMIRSIYIFILLLFASEVYSQEKTTIVYSNNQLKITAHKSACERKDEGTHMEYYYLKFENLTPKKIKITYKKQLWYNNKCLTCSSNSNEHNDKLILNKKETIEGDCFNHTENKLKIFSKMLNIEATSVLTEFKIENVVIKTVE